MSYSYSSARGTRGRRPQNSRSGRNNNRRRSNNNGGKRRHGQYIDPARFVAKASPKEAESYEALHMFSDFDLKNQIKLNVEAKGYVTPSPIQDQAIPAGLTGRDVLGIAGTGTGKTAAFALPVLNQLIHNQDSRAIIIAPTRELAMQISQETRSLAKNTGLRDAVLIGGSPMGLQLRDLQRKPRLIIGTPGRIKDHTERKSLKLANFDMLVLDEVDRMLDMGFVDDIRNIISQTSNERQSFFFSATMDTRVRGLINDFANDPVSITIQASSASENVHQDVIKYHDNAHKIDSLHDLLLGETVSKVIVFDETQRDVDRLSKELLDRGFSAETIHGGKTQGHRKRAITKFKNNDVNILVATDVAARGIDIADVTHVINYSIPQQYDDYIHRIGRAGRAGKIGYAYTFVSHR